MLDNLYSKKKVMDYLKDKSIFPNKNRGQNFLCDRNIAYNIANTVPNGFSRSNYGLEIGGGLGALSSMLIDIYKKNLTIVEYDNALYLADKKVTAIFASNDFSAMGALSGIKEAGLSVPEDISLAGYDDIDFVSFLEVPLTTVRQPVNEIGKRATQIIHEIVQNNDCGKKIEILKPELIVRKSTRRI